MSKKLKNFIDENRREFDNDLPSAAAWQQIEKSIGVKKPVKQFSVRDIYKWSAAAAVFFITATCFYFLIIRKNNTDTGVAKTGISVANNNHNNGNTTDISRMAPEYAAEARKIYQSIEIQQQQLKAIAEEQPELYSQFSEDLAALDSSYRVLKAQAVQTPNREVIIRAMLQNLQLQAELLGKQLGILNEYKNNKTEKNEKNYPRI
ncbi:MAG TPA: hypothetical protein VJ111_15445 [Chitinophagaceae bacterium]|nr:hypothetical protein [Chitinophagaceae bacterium]